MSDSRGVGRKDREGKEASNWHVSKQVPTEGGRTSVSLGAREWYKTRFRIAPLEGREMGHSSTKVPLSLLGGYCSLPGTSAPSVRAVWALVRENHQVRACRSCQLKAELV